MQPFYTIIETAVERSLDAYINAVSGKSIMGPLMSNAGLKGKKLMRIGDLSKETGETVFALRYWLKEGILKVANYTKGGY